MLGRAGQHLFLDRPGGGHRRGYPDAAASFRRSKSARAARKIREGALHWVGIAGVGHPRCRQREARDGTRSFIETSNTAYFRHDYDGEHADMRRLYEQAKLDQWNAATDIDWEKPLDTDGGLIADDLVDIHGSPFWNRLSPTQRVEINRLVARWRISTLMHGEHGAMLVCSQMVENVVGQDAKLFQASQVVDEARHNQGLHRYIALRLDAGN